MPISQYLAGLRQRVGNNTLIVVPSVMAILFDAKGRILLARAAESDVWVAPGGSIDPDELPADAVMRETWEETGLLVQPVAVVGVYGGRDFLVTYANGDRVEYVMIVFECIAVGGELRPDGREIREFRYFSQSEVAGLPLPSWVQRVLPDAFHHDAGACFAPPSWAPPRRPS